MPPNFDRDSLLAAALAARSRAYAPYSKFAVGAALLTTTGEVFTGCNVENCSYGLTICAERTAACSAVAAGRREFTALALALSGGGTPCGACRQFLAEFAPKLPILIIDADQPSRITETTLEVLLPGRFALDADR
ncbi:MAG: cytidine deaminase [Planctomycetales bacterium]|nr:cytidine deaminase [Planctomycetales bacterium]MBN8624035.1 cytidine deaminase [Planctomycetota bacterium]